MSLAALAQVYDEVRRLAVAGSALAAGDFRLKKLIPPLEKSGEKAPVFSKVAQAVQKLVDAGQKESAGALLELNSLTTAILYTQGETGRTGEFKPIVSSNMGLTIANTSARTLKPLLEALTTTGSGRLETIKEAHERGAFKDLRLMKPALKAIDDPYPEVGEFIVERVLPMYGKPIYAEVRAGLTLKGKASDGRRLKLLHRLDPEATRELVQQALDDGSKDVKLAAIQCLGGSTDAIPFLLEQAKAKARDVRQAALESLVSFTEDSVLDVLQKTFLSDDVWMLHRGLANNPSPRLRAFVVAEIRKLCDEMLAAASTGKKKDKKYVPPLARFRGMLHGLSGRKDPPAIDLLASLFDQRDQILQLDESGDGSDVITEVLDLMLLTDSKPLLQSIARAADSLRATHIHYALIAAARHSSPKDVYAKFAPLYQARTKSKGRSKASEETHLRSEQIAWAIRQGVRRRDSDFEHEFEDGTPSPRFEVDPRWLDDAIALDDFDLVLELARPGHQGVATYFNARVDAALNAKKFDPDYEFEEVLDKMIELKHPDIVDKFVLMLKKPFNPARSWYWARIASRIVPKLPATAIPQLEALLPEINEKLMEAILPSLDELKQSAASKN